MKNKSEKYFRTISSASIKSLFLHPENHLSHPFMLDWSESPFSSLSVSFLLGVLAGRVCTLQWGLPPSPIPIFLAMNILLILLIVSNRPIRRSTKWFTSFILCACTIFLLTGYIYSSFFHQEASTIYGNRIDYHIHQHNSMQNAKALHLQEQLHSHLQSSSVGSSAEKSIIEAMTIGHRSNMDKSLRKQFAAAGISHMLALSGFHLSAIYLLLYILLRPLRNVPRVRIAVSVIVVLMLWFYALLTGMSPSIVRAVIFCTIIEICHLSRRRVNLLNSCSIASFIILLFDPLFIGHIGFQLSFLSVMGIALWQNQIPRNWLLAILTITVICSLVTFPLVAYYFGTLPLYGLLTNTIATILAYPVVILSMLWWLLSLISIPATWLLHVITFFTHLLISLVRLVSGLPFSTISYSPSVTIVLLWYAALFLLYLILKRTLFKNTYTSCYEN